jgi:electron transport complex protein RnfG
MREMVKMVVVLTILCSVSGGLLAALRDGTKDKIENQQLEFVKGPAIRKILVEGGGATNDPIKDRFKLKVDGREESFFVGIVNGKPKLVTFETSGKGFGGALGMVVGVDVTTDKIIGVAVTTHSETPGIGARAQTDPKFAKQFAGMPLAGEFKVKSDGGKVDALSGATVTSRGVSGALTGAAKLYQDAKPALMEKLNTLKK